MLNIIRRAFGFSPETEEDDEDYNPVVTTYDASVPEVPARSAAPAPAAQPPVAREVKTEQTADPTLPADLFDAVIRIFNDAQPDFVKKCLDTDAQRRYIIDSLDASLRSRAESATRDSAAKWRQEKEELEKKIAELQGGDSVVENLRKENRRLQLSVDRQKRALLDRINDLESQIARHAEEKERFYSRRKSPADSEQLTAANARIAELEKSNSELESAKAELESEKAELENSKSVLESTVAGLNRKIAAIHSTAKGSGTDSAELEARIAELEAECKNNADEAARQSILREQLEVKTNMSDTIINDLRNQNAAARRELDKLHEEEAQQFRLMEQIRRELDGFENLKARKDAKIAELSDSNASLRRTIETNLYNQANTEMKLRKEIKELQTQLEETARANASGSAAPAESNSSADKADRRRRGRSRKVKIDGDLDNTDWFAGSKHDDPDFGYHEPPRRPANDNEAQLSLF